MKKECLVKTLVMGIVVLFIATGAVSAFNANLTDESKAIIITNNLATMDNHPPDAPWITGSQFISPGTHEWTFKAIDSDGDNVSYQIDWGDGGFDDWFGWYASSEEITRSHYYPAYGFISIAARANDTHGAIGEWGYMEVVIPKNQQMTNFLIFRFFSQFMERFLR